MISTKLTIVAAIVTISLCTISYASSNHGHSRLAVALKPEYLTFNYDQGALEINELDDLLQSLLGYSIHSDIKWKGLVNKQALSMPNAIMLFLGDSSYVNLESFSSKLINVDQKHHHINMNSFDSLEGTNTAVKKYNSLSAPLEFSADCKTGTNPEVYIFKITQDDAEQLAKSIDKIVTSYQTNCTSDLLALVLTYKEQSTVTEENTANVRSKRAATTDEITVTNEAVFYSDNYPAMFNLFFWTGLLLAVSIFGVSYCMWNMDPGLDTVIYRMTSQRTKKDQ